MGLVPSNLISSLEIWLDAKDVLNESRALGRAKYVLYGFSDHTVLLLVRLLPSLRSKDQILSFLWEDLQLS